MISPTLLILTMVSFVMFFPASASTIDCSLFKTEEEIFASLPFPVSIHPARSQPDCATYAYFDGKRKVVQLSLCNEKSIPLALFCLRNLQKLVLRGGNFTIPAEISQLKSSLTYLEVSNKDNTIMDDRAISSEVFNLLSLRTLILHNCGLETLPEAIHQLVNLTDLTLTKNRLSALPVGMNQLSKLSTVDVSDNRPLRSLDSLNGRSLSFLIAKNCSIDHLPRNITLLMKLDLSNNSLTSLDGVDTLSTGIDGWNKPGVFLFNSNQIESIPDSIQSVALVELNLMANKLTAVPEAIFKVRSLERLNMQNNMFSEKKREWIAGEARATSFSLSI